MPSIRRSADLCRRHLTRTTFVGQDEAEWAETQSHVSWKAAGIFSRVSASSKIELVGAQISLALPEMSAGSQAGGAAQINAEECASCGRASLKEGRKKHGVTKAVA